MLSYLGPATADSDILEARYVDIVPNARVVQAVDFVSDDPVFAGTMTMTSEVTTVDGGTRVDIVAADISDGLTAEDHAQGLASSLANLAENVEKSSLTISTRPRTGVSGRGSVALLTAIIG